VLISMLVASSFAMSAKKRQLTPANAQPVATDVAVPAQPTSDAAVPAASDDAAAPVADAATVEEPADPVVSDNADAPVQTEAADDVQAPADDEPAVSDADAAAPASAVADDSDNVVAVASDESMQSIPDDYFIYDPLEMMYGVAGGNDYYMYDAAANGNSTVRVAVLDNVFYFTKATTLIEEVESLLAYEEKLFNSATFDEYLSQPPPDYDYEYISLAPEPANANSQ